MTMTMPFLFTKPTTFTGTATELQKRGVKVNGVPVDAVTLSIFNKYGVVKSTGVEDKGEHKRGRAAKIFELNSMDSFKVTC